ncbi:MAG: hypothetical protein H0U80_02290 [Solirubrobacterales bacterium]|nr:hypothetical protein [Solirubrobacterales bacterium]
MTRPPELPTHLAAILDDLQPAAREHARHHHRRQRQRKAVIATLLGTAALAATAGASGSLLGWFAPSSIQNDLSKVDSGLPAELRYDPDVTRARAVARAGAAVLFAAKTRDGGYCLDLLVNGADRPGDATCTSPGDALVPAFSVQIPFADASTAPRVLAGRVNERRVASLVIELADGSERPIALSDGYFVEVLDPSDAEQAHRLPSTLVGRDDTSAVVAEQLLPPTGDQPVKEGPIEATTILVGEDLTRVSGVEGTVNSPGAVRVRLELPDGDRLVARLRAGGGFRLTIPIRARRQLASAPATLTAVDARGRAVADTVVAAPSLYRARERGRTP